MTMLFGLSAYERVQSQELTWVFNKVTRDIQGNEESRLITYSVNSEITKIEAENEIIYIDYANYILYRYNKPKGPCLKFPINSSRSTKTADIKNDLEKRNTSLISDFKVFTTDEYKEIANYDCYLKRILFGADLAKFQMVAPLIVHEFGQKFTEAMVSYYVSQDVFGFNCLLKIAQKHSDIFQNNPLLRQIDIVGLFEILHGFPVQVSKTVGNVETITTLLVDPQPRDKILFPKECHSLISEKMGTD